jgi:hypothetical protein
MPAYERLHALDGFGDPEAVQAGLDLVWSAARGEPHDETGWAASKARLLDLAPDLELRPLLAVAGMECLAATWDAMTVAEDGTPSKALASWDAYIGVIEDFLLNRDHPHALIASNEPDPFGLRHDPLWQECVALGERLFGALEESEPDLATKVQSLRTWATDADARSFVETLESLSDRIRRDAR